MYAFDEIEKFLSCHDTKVFPIFAYSHIHAPTTLFTYLFYVTSKRWFYMHASVFGGLSQSQKENTCTQQFSRFLVLTTTTATATENGTGVADDDEDVVVADDDSENLNTIEIIP